MTSATTPVTEESKRTALLDYLNQEVSVTPFPDAVQRLLREIGPNSDQNSLARIVESDAGLSSILLRQANSAQFGAKYETKSIASCIARVGNVGLKQIALTAAAKALYASGCSRTTRYRQYLWQHAIGVAAISRAIDPTYAHGDHFVASIFHDTGKLYLLDRFAQDYLKMCYEFRGVELTHHERVAFGCSHDELGMVLTNKWGVLESAQMAAGFHHRPADAFQDKAMVSLIAVADQLSHKWGADFDGPDAFEAGEIGFGEFKFNEKLLEAIFHQAKSNFNEMMTVLN